MIRLKKEAKKKLIDFIIEASYGLLIVCGPTSILCFIFIFFMMYTEPRYSVSQELITFFIVCLAITIISAIPSIYFLTEKIIDSFEVAPRKTKKEKILESDKILEYDEEDMLQNMTIQDLLDYYKERDLVFYEFLISACNDFSSMEETHVKDAISVLIEYSDLYIDSPTFGEYTEYERTTLHTEIMEHLGNILNRLVTFNQKKWRMK